MFDTALLKSDELTEVLFENAPDAILLVDASGNLIRVNAQGARMFGYEKNELIGQPLEMLLPERFRRSHVSHRQDYYAHPRTRQMGQGIDLFAVRKDGTEFPVDIMLRPVPTSKGAMVISVVRDVTQRKEAEVALKYSAATFKGLFNQTFQFMALLTPDGIVKEVNRAKLEVIGATLEEVQGKPFSQLSWWSFSESVQKQLQAAIEQARNGEFVRYETEHIDTNGRLITVDFSLKPVLDDAGNVLVLIAEGRDITELKRLMQQREDYVATLTHDLKTPILAANRAMKLLLDGDFGPVSEPQTQILQTILDSNEAMYRLVRTLLDVYRYDSGAKTLSLAEHNLSEAVTKLIGELQPIADSKQLLLTPELPPDAVVTVCDHEEIRRVLQNLIDNALKFTPRGGTVTIRIECPAEHTVVTVTDTGKGISEDDQCQLFQRFWQQAPGGRHYASTGLGLYLCRKIVELHGGRIWCESTLGAGSAFRFTLPNAVSGSKHLK